MFLASFEVCDQFLRSHMHMHTCTCTHPPVPLAKTLSDDAPEESLSEDHKYALDLYRNHQVCQELRPWQKVAFHLFKSPTERSIIWILRIKHRENFCNFKGDNRPHVYQRVASKYFVVSLSFYFRHEFSSVLKLNKTFFLKSSKFQLFFKCSKMQ